MRTSWRECGTANTARNTTSIEATQFLPTGACPCGAAPFPKEQKMFANATRDRSADRLVMKAVIAAAIFMGGYLAGESSLPARPNHQGQQVAQAKG